MSSSEAEIRGTPRPDACEGNNDEEEEVPGEISSLSTAPIPSICIRNLVRSQHIWLPLADIDDFDNDGGGGGDEDDDDDDDSSVDVIEFSSCSVSTLPAWSCPLEKLERIR